MSVATFFFKWFFSLVAEDCTFQLVRDQTEMNQNT